MKLLSFAFVMLIGFISTSSVQAQPATTAPSEETAVKKAIEDETQGFMTRNEQRWSNAWVHAPYISWSSERGPFQLLGWENIHQAFAYNFVSGQPDRPTVSFQQDNFKVSVLDKTATATFIQLSKNADGKLLGKSNEVRVLEKQGNDWKMIYVYSRTIN
ncbi:MAG: hypothetical protein INR73_10655 [Williamsia sp.]|nr:hypothetical protein [Williamsia sp.]